MTFNFLCTSNNSSYLNEFSFISELTLQPLNLTYQTSSQLIKKNKPKDTNFQKIEIYTKYNKNNIPNFINLNFFSIKISSKTESTIIFLVNESQKEKKKSILYIQENNCDIGTQLPFLIDLSIQLKLDIISFDYSNRGKKINIKNLYNDIDSVMEFINKKLNIKPKNLIIFSNGIGAIPACYISSKEEYLNLFRLILISPLFDQKTIKLLKEINCNTYLIQEKKNKKINHIHISKYCHLIKNIYEWFPKEENFQKVLENKRCKFYCKIKNFIFNSPKSSHLNLSYNLSNESNQTLCSSPHTLVKIDEDKDEEGDFYLNQSIYAYQKSNVFSDEEDVDCNE